MYDLASKELLYEEEDASAVAWNAEVEEMVCFSSAKDGGTLAIKKCLFDMPQEESGWYYGSDGVRSPLHFMRNPGEPAYDGVVPPEVLA